MGSVTIANGGVFPNIHQTMLPKKAGKGKGDIGFASQEFKCLFGYVVGSWETGVVDGFVFFNGLWVG